MFRISASVFNWGCFSLILLLLLSSKHAVSSSIVESLPGFPGSLPFRLETGYIAVDEKEDVQFFYYFVESDRNPRDDPLVLFFTGGPGCSGFSGLAFEIGPIHFNRVEYNGSLPTFVLNPHSWTKVSSIIFLDGPVGTGFSYSRTWQGYQSNNFVFAKRSFNFLKKWLLDHPKFISNPFYLGGDSYSGMVVPIVAEEIAKSIEAGHIPAINFQGYLLGNPSTDQTIDKNSKVPFAHRMALIPDELYKSAKRACKGQYVQRHRKNSKCAKYLQAISVRTDKISSAHILHPKCQTTFTANEKLGGDQRILIEKQPSEAKSIQLSLDFRSAPAVFPKLECLNYENVYAHYWANNNTVQEALHVRKGTIETWIRCNMNIPYVSLNFSVVGFHKRLHERGYRALIYSGDHDMVISYIGTQTWIKSLNLSVVTNWRPWLVEDQVGGYVTEYSNDFTFATVKGGGHTAPEYQPKECFAMFERWISQEPL
ncbi:hypothetical protein UlMin_039007 [Ulmus minor]